MNRWVGSDELPTHSSLREARARARLSCLWPWMAAMLDVLVIGGGNAALGAALVAREAGASVLLLASGRSRSGRLAP
jgi:NADPH-dependent 2,4-dienoyl-CoA reductase/sulfur reductase-like enzyme